MSELIVTKGNDSLNGGSDNNSIYELASNDLLYGYAEGWEDAAGYVGVRKNLFAKYLAD